MNKNGLIYITIVTSTIGCTLLGLGLGILFNEIWSGTLIGLGIGMIITTIILLKAVRKLSHSKDTSQETITTR